MSLLNDFTARYSSSESWLYDRYIAPAVMDMGETLVDEHLRLLPQGAEVLEVGCGGGQFARSQLDKRSDLRWVGLDVSVEQIARARQRNAKHESASFVVGDALELPFSDARFDALVSIGPTKARVSRSACACFDPARSSSWWKRTAAVASRTRGPSSPAGGFLP
jgi:SAM-dependent methyltransferase